MCNHGSTGETRERAVPGRKVPGSVGHVMNGRRVSMEVKMDLSSTATVPTLTYASKTWAWKEIEECRQWRSAACVVKRRDGMSNESV